MLAAAVMQPPSFRANRFMPASSPSTANRAVFLSYAREDTAAASRIAEALRSNGDREWALLELARLLSIPCPTNVHLARHDPFFAPLRDDPRFDALLSDPKNDAPLF